jgi:hypothetical protein
MKLNNALQLTETKKASNIKSLIDNPEYIAINAHI